MLLKTKLLLSLGGLGVVGGTGVGVYCLKNKDVSDEQSAQGPAGSVAALPGKPVGNEGSVDGNLLENPTTAKTTPIITAPDTASQLKTTEGEENN